jgi:siroheme synthase (precorrin-2 oxidase/ferrochelatase)
MIYKLTVVAADYADMRVAVIGTGSSAIQIIPQVQKKAKHLTAFMRSVTWISPPVGLNFLEELKEQTNDDSQKKSSQGQYWYTEEEKQKFRDDPQALLEYRQKLEAGLNARFDMFIAESETAKMVQKMFKQQMMDRIGPGHEELKKRLIPTWSVGCRRLTPGDGYLEALVKDSESACCLCEVS